MPAARLVPAVLLTPTALVMFLGAIMGYELLNNMWGYHQPTKPAALIVDNVSDMFGVKPKE